MIPALLALVMLPAVAALGIAGFRRPLHVLLPLYAAFVPYGSAIAVPGLNPRYTSVSSLLGYALIAALASKLVTRGWELPRIPLELPVWLLFLGVTGATVFWSLEPRDTTTDFVSFVGVVVMYLLIRLSPVDRSCVRRTEAGILVGGIAGATYALLQLVTGTLPRSEVDGIRFGENLTDPNHLAAALALPLILAAARLATSRGTTRALFMVAVLMLLLAIVLTASRGGVLAAMLALLVLALTGQRRVVALATGALAVTLIILGLSLTPSAVSERLGSTDSNLRTDIWLVGLHACSDHCLTGSGWGTFSLAYAEKLPQVPNAEASGRGQMFLEPHNIWVLAVIELGVLGVVLMTAGLVLAARTALRLPASRRGPPMAALAALSVAAMLLTSLEFKYFWLVLIYVGLVAGAEDRADDAESSVQPVLPTPQRPGDAPAPRVSIRR